MKKLAILPALLAAAPALAHPGAHMHPHGIDAATLILATLFAGGVAAVLIRGRK